MAVDYEKLQMVVFRFQPHSLTKQPYDRMHTALNTLYSTDLSTLDTLFVDEERTALAGNSDREFVNLIIACIVHEIVDCPGTTNDPELVLSMLNGAALRVAYGRVSPTRIKKQSFAAMTKAAIDENKSPIAIEILVPISHLFHLGIRTDL